MINLQLNDYYNEVDSIKHTITNRIDKIESLPLKDANNMITEVNQLISSGSLILAKMHESDSSIVPYLKNNYEQLESFRSQLSSITTRIQMKMLTQIEDNNKPTIPNHSQQNHPVDVNLMTDYNEALLQGAVSNLHNIHNNLTETSTNLKQQGEKVNNTINVMNQGTQNIKNNTAQLNSMNCTTKCQKLWMIIVNVLLFMIIILLIILKILNFFRG